MAKVYITKGKYLTYSLVLNVGNRKVSVEFTGALNMPRTPGKYFTADVNIQKALEHHSQYNKRFTLLSEVVTTPPAVPVRHTLEQVDPIQEVEINNPVPPVTTADIQAGIVNAQGAKDYLVERIKGTTYADYKNVSQILAAAKKYNIEFPDWQKWVERPQ